MAQPDADLASKARREFRRRIQYLAEVWGDTFARERRESRFSPRCSSRTTVRRPDGGNAEVQRIWFKVVYVFDISQTDGTPLPELPTSSFGERGEDMLNRLLRFAESHGITVRFVEKCSLNGAAGTSKGTEIEIRTAETDTTTQAATLAHELAHSLLHFTPDGKRITTHDGKEVDKQQRELEAEATAYVVGAYFGIQSASNFYLASYRVIPAMFLEAVETIATTVRTILSRCQELAARGRRGFAYSAAGSSRIVTCAGNSGVCSLGRTRVSSAFASNSIQRRKSINTALAE